MTSRRRATAQRRTDEIDRQAPSPVIEEALLVFEREHGLDAAGLRRGLAQFRTYVAGRGMHTSAVRDLIAVAALSQPGHFEALDVVASLRRAKLATAYEASVYRTLPLLVEAGLVRQVMFSERPRQLYERAFEQERHDHLVCTECGQIVELVLDVAAAKNDAAQRFDFEIDHAIHELLGRCAQCRRR